MVSLSIYKKSKNSDESHTISKEESVKLKFSCSDENDSLAKYKFVLDFKDFNKVLKIAGIKLK